jgi:hypothetical protein
MITGPVRFHGYFERDSHLCKNKQLLYFESKITVCPSAPGYLADLPTLLGWFDQHALADQGSRKDVNVIRNVNWAILVLLRT